MKVPCDACAGLKVSSHLHPRLEKVSQNSVLVWKARVEYVRGTLDQILRLSARLSGIFPSELPAEVGIGGFQVKFQVKARLEMFQSGFA